MTYRVVILNRFPDLAQRLIGSIRKTHENPPPILVIADGHLEQFGPGVETVPAQPGPFCFARNANLGLVRNQIDGLDTILINDDCELVDDGTLDALAAEAVPSEIGMVAPLVDGGIGNAYQDYRRKAELWRPEWRTINLTGTTPNSLPICFVCVYIKGAMVQAIGPMDEDLLGYGFDDNDYCIRARKAGWKTALVGLLRVKHGDGTPGNALGKSYSTSYARNPHLAEMIQLNQAVFGRKHALVPIAPIG